MKNHLFALFIALFITLSSFAQNGNLTGKIISSASTSLHGINIRLKNTSYKTKTDSLGNYQLSDIGAGKYILQVSGAHILTEEKTINIHPNDSTKENIEVKTQTTFLDEVVVSAGRTSEKLSEIPASISVVNLAKIANLTQATSNVSQILEFSVPGLAQSTGSFSNQGQSLRGRNFLVMIDGVPQSTPIRDGKVDIRSINPNDLARIEVIKGATSIYGNGSSGGVINYITKNTSTHKSISGHTQLWSTANLVNTSNAIGGGFYQSLSGKLNKFEYYLSGSLEKTANRYDAKGFPIFPVYGLDNTLISSGFTKLFYQIQPNQRISLRSNWYKTRQNSPFKAQQPILTVLDAQGNYELQHAIGIPGKEPGVPPGVQSINNQLEYEINDLWNKSTHFTIDVYQQYVKNIFFYSDSFQNGGQSVIHSNKWGIRPNFNTKLDLSKSIKASLTYGLDILRDKSNQALLDGRGWVPDVTLLNTAPYLQSSLRIKDLWSIKLGIRYDHMYFDVADYYTLPRREKVNGGFAKSIAVKGGALTFNNLSFNAGARYIAHKEFIPYVNYSQGFSIPDIGRTLRDATQDNVQQISLQPIVTNNYEFGFISEFPIARFEAVGYYSSSKYGVNLVFNNLSERFEVSQNPQRIFGGEASLDFSLLNNQLEFGSSFSYVEGIQFSQNNPYQLSYLIGTNINPAKWTNYVTIKPIPSLTCSIRVLHSGARKRFLPQSKTDENGNTTYSYNNGQVPVTAYTTVDAQVGYKLNRKCSIAMSVNNLLNKFYLPPVYLSGAAFTNNGLSAEGCNAKLSLDYHF